MQPFFEMPKIKQQELEERQQYATALDVYCHSTNDYTYQQIGEMDETGKGMSLDIPIVDS